MNLTPAMTKPAFAQILMHVSSLLTTSSPPDLARGAQHYGLRPDPLYVESDVLDNYAEVDVARGENVVGAILAVLAGRPAVGPGPGPAGLITVCLRRRDDGRLVEVDFHLDSIHHLGREHLVLRQAGELDLEDDSAA